MKKLITILLIFFSTQLMSQEVKVVEQINNNKHTLLIFLNGHLHQVEKYVKRRDKLVAIGVWEVYNEEGDLIKKMVYKRGRLLKTSTYIDGKWINKKIGI